MDILIETFKMVFAYLAASPSVQIVLTILAPLVGVVSGVAAANRYSAEPGKHRRRPDSIATQALIPVKIGRDVVRFYLFTHYYNLKSR